MESLADKKRLAWADFARAIAIFLVILNHCISAYYTTRAHFGTYSTFSMIFINVLFPLSRLGVPIFLFLSGYFLLSKRYKKEDAKKFYKNKWLRLFITAEIWLVIYHVVLAIAGEQSFSIVGLLKNMIFTDSVPYFTNFWYVNMILGFYLLVPHVANYLNSKPRLSLRFPVLFMAIYAFSIPVINTVLSIFGQEQVTASIYSGFTGGVYGFYLLLGYWIRKGEFNKLKTRSCMLLFITSFTLLCLARFLTTIGNTFDAWYDNALVLVPSFFLFILLSRVTIPSRFAERLFYFFSHHSFGVFLSHKLFILAAVKLCLLDSLVMPAQVLVLSVAVTPMSYIFCALVSKIPHVGETLLYLR